MRKPSLGTRKREYSKGDRLDEPTWLFTRSDLLVLLAALALAGAVAAYMWFGVGRGSWGQDSSRETGSAANETSTLYAVVQNSEGFYEALPLSQDTTFAVSSSLGTNEVEIANGRIRVAQADCANQVCVNAGWISLEGQTITCLPHRLVIQVVADPADASAIS